MAAIVGDLAAAEEIKALKDLMGALGATNLECRQDGAKLAASPRQGYLFNSTIAGVDAADAILLIGTNPRWEAPVLNARIRKTWLTGDLKIANVGEAYDLTYPVEQLGAGADVLEAIAAGSHPFAQVLKDAKRPMLILGPGAVARADGAADPEAGREDRRRDRHDRPGRQRGRGRLERLQRAAHRGVAAWPRSISVSSSERRDMAGILDGAAQGRDRVRLSARRRRIRHGASSARPSSSIRAPMAMPARIAPT